MSHMRHVTGLKHEMMHLFSISFLKGAFLHSLQSLIDVQSIPSPILFGFYLTLMFMMLI